MSNWSWSRLESEVRCSGIKRTYSVMDCEVAANALNIAGQLPPSYVELMRRFGSGQWKPDLFIHAPSHPMSTAAITSASPNLKRMLTVRLSGGQHSDKASLINSLLPFGGDGSGHVFCWDQRSRAADGEMMIYVVEEEYMKATPCGRDMVEFLGAFWIERGLDRVMPYSDGSWGCKAEFCGDGDL